MVDSYGKLVGKSANISNIYIYLDLRFCWMLLKTQNIIIQQMVVVFHGDEYHGPNP